MEGVLAVIEMLGNTIRQLQQQIAQQQQRIAALEEALKRREVIVPEVPEEAHG